jgi:hypothetical protein
MWQIFEYIDARGDGVLSSWNLEKRERVRLSQKLDLLQQYGLDAPGLVGGPNIGKQRHIYKLKVKGGVQLRPMFCRGPANRSTELTFLAQATERDGQITPPTAPVVAELRRRQLIAGTAERRRR